MADNLASKLVLPEFNPLDYIKQKVVSGNGVKDLISEKERVKNLADETNGLLKKNVYKNYAQFIETAKEISYLEGEMYQLSHMLNEQQTLLSSLLDISIAAAKPSESSAGHENKSDDDNHKNLSLLLEKIEGCATVLEVRGRTVLYSGELTELSVVDYKPIQTVYCVLLDESLMISIKAEDSRGPMQYRYQALYELDSLAVVNVKEELNAKNVIKILMFPEIRLFQCFSTSSKKEWLAKIDLAKKKRLFSAESLALTRAPNPFEDDGPNPFEDNSPNGTKLEVPSWLLELPEELDVCIALREFDKAVDLIQKANAHCVSFPRNPTIRDFKIKVDNRTKQLVNMLSEELRVSPDRSLYGGPRTARKAVGVLLRLGKSSKASSLYLRRCSAMLKQCMKQQKVENGTVNYIKKLCSVFFQALQETGKEFTRAFVNKDCASAFVMWSKLQLEQFVQIFSKHVFTPQVSASVATDCIACARKECRTLSDIGLDLSFLLDDLLSSHIERLAAEMREKLLEAIKLRASDDKWRPQNLQNAAGLRKVLDDLHEMGIAHAESYVYDDCWISLTVTTTAFAKMYLNFVDDLLKLYTTGVHKLLNDALSVTFQTQVLHVKNTLQSTSNPAERKFISKNAAFLLDVLKVAESLYFEHLKMPCAFVQSLASELNPLVSTKYSTSKYSSAVYI